MTKAEVRVIADKYNMQILRDPVTREAHGVWIDTANRIPELDPYADSADPAQLPCGVTRVLQGEKYRYTIECPTSWFDLWGWR